MFLLRAETAAKLSADHTKSTSDANGGVSSSKATPRKSNGAVADVTASNKIRGPFRKVATTNVGSTVSSQEIYSAFADRLPRDTDPQNQVGILVYIYAYVCV